MKKQILIVVDVQRAYSPFFTDEHVQKVQSYVENTQWDDVIVRYIGEEEYSVIHEEEVLHTFQQDSIHIPSFLNKKEYHFSERWFGYELEDSDEILELVKDKLYKVRQDDKWWYMSETPNGDMYCPCRTIESLLSGDAEIHIIGGFRNQCVKEVYDFLTLAGLKNVLVNEDYCFEEVEPNVEAALRFTSEWVSPR